MAQSTDVAYACMLSRSMSTPRVMPFRLAVMGVDQQRDRECHRRSISGSMIVLIVDLETEWACPLSYMPAPDQQSLTSRLYVNVAEKSTHKLDSRGYLMLVLDKPAYPQKRVCLTVRAGHGHDEI